MTERRFPIRRGPLWAPLLAGLGAWRDNSFVEVTAENVRGRMGFFFDETFPRAELAAVRVRPWPLIFGVGWRTDFRGHVGLIGAYGQVVEIGFSRKLRVRLIPFLAWPTLPCDRLSVSVEDPDALVAALADEAA